MTNNMSEKIAEEKNLDKLFEKSLRIPPYQRPYKWDTEQVESLLKDIDEAKDQNIDIPYVLGTIIVCKDKNNLDLDIVDGQQRLTTLSILLYCLNEQKSLLNQEFRHTVSKENIKCNYNYIEKWLEKKNLKDDDDFKKFILEKISFVLVTAPSLDDAFVFFDSQNTRGKALERHDLLKAHHLRYIKDHGVATSCVKHWEKIGKEKGRLNKLVDTLLGRVRKWSRRDYGNLNVEAEFKAQRITPQNESYYRLNHYHQPPVFKAWRYIEDKVSGLEIIFRDIDALYGTKKLRFMSDSKKYMPFQITQPLEGGEQFFWFVEKYDQLHRELFEDTEHPISELFKSLCEFLDTSDGVNFIKDLFDGCILFYYDKFGFNQFDEISVWFEHALFYLRLRQHVKYTSINAYIRDDFNLVAIINEAAFPEYIINKIREFTDIEYKKILQEVKEDTGIRNRYFKKFYGEKGFYKTGLFLNNNNLSQNVKGMKRAILD